MTTPFDFNAMKLAQQKLQPQESNLGIIQFHLSSLPGLENASKILELGLVNFRFDQVRRVQPITISYLQGKIKVPGATQELGDLSVQINDYINSEQRLMLMRWFDLVYNEKTGTGALVGELKTDATMILFSRDGQARAEILLQGLFPLSDPPLPNIDYSGGSQQVVMDMQFAVDFYFELKLGNKRFSSNFGSQGLRDASAAVNAALGVNLSTGFGATPVLS